MKIRGECHSKSVELVKPAVSSFFLEQTVRIIHHNNHCKGFPQVPAAAFRPEFGPPALGPMLIRHPNRAVEQASGCPLQLRQRGLRVRL